MSAVKIDRAFIAIAVKKVVIAESRLSVNPEQIKDDEPLNGPLLRINSFGFVGMLIQLEDQLNISLSDDLFVGKSFHNVSDLIEVISSQSEANA